MERPNGLPSCGASCSSLPVGATAAEVGGRVKAETTAAAARGGGCRSCMRLVELLLTFNCPVLEVVTAGAGRALTTVSAEAGAATAAPASATTGLGCAKLLAAFAWLMTLSRTSRSRWAPAAITRRSAASSSLSLETAANVEICCSSSRTPAKVSSWTNLRGASSSTACTSDTLPTTGLVTFSGRLLHPLHGVSQDTMSPEAGPGRAVARRMRR
mmetsp:Transcript_26469/g.83900  ORF Transcript_26469/g.83900 Transcript_26469/m.83900 type:complete len:214 (+) Transcript_26469:459-1100(+)